MQIFCHRCPCAESLCQNMMKSVTILLLVFASPAFLHQQADASQKSAAPCAGSVKPEVVSLEKLKRSTLISIRDVYRGSDAKESEIDAICLKMKEWVGLKKSAQSKEMTEVNKKQPESEPKFDAGIGFEAGAGIDAAGIGGGVSGGAHVDADTKAKAITRAEGESGKINCPLDPTGGAAGGLC